MIPPGETIGILGGGQLGRMIAMAAAQLGYRCHIYAPEADSIAAEVSAAFTCAAWDDGEAMAKFAADCAVVTYEFENVPVAPLAALGATPLLAGPLALESAQDRVNEKRFVTELGGTPAPFFAVDNAADLAAAMAEIGIDITAATPKVLTGEAVESSDVVITMGCGDTCPYFPGVSYRDWKLDDPAGQGIEAVRPIRDEIRSRIENLVAELL